MHSLFLPSWYPNLKSPYDGNFIQNHAKALALYDQVTVLYCTSLPDIVENRVEISESNNLKEILIYYPQSRLKLVRLIHKVKAYLKGFKLVSQYDIIHTHVFFSIIWIGILSKLISRKKIIHTEHSSYFGELSILKKFLFKIFSKFISHHTPVSKQLCNTLINLGVNSKKITVIPNTIDIDHFDIKSKPKKSKIHFLHISQYQDPRKNLEGILRVFERLSLVYDNFFLEIGGDGDYEWLTHTMNHFQIPSESITASEKYSYNDLPTKYSQVDAFILFSQFENFGVVLAESIACGTPVIATRVGGVVDFVNETNGILVDPNDEEGLYQAIELFLNEKIKFDPISVRNSIIDYVSEESVGSKLIQIYKKEIEHFG